MNRNLLLLCLVVSLLAAGLVITVLDSYSQEPDQHSVSGSETTFSYQGYLSSGSSPAEGQFDFSFTLQSALTGDHQVGPVIGLDDVNVASGQFSVQLDFGDVFDGSPLWLEIGVSSDKDSAPYTILSPRHGLGVSPYAGYAYRSPWSGLEGVPAKLSDGDNDPLTLLSCGPGQVPKWNGANWLCAADNDTLATLTCVGDKILRRSGSTWICDEDRDSDTTYTAGDGLEQAGTSFAISSTYQLPQTCDPGQISEWNGVFWDCGVDDLGEGGGGGTITGVFGGDGLIGSATSGSVTLHAGDGVGLQVGEDYINLDTPYRLPQMCDDGQVAQWDQSIEEWVCDPDDDTLATTICADGQILKWEEGTTFCADDAVDDIVTYDEIFEIVGPGFGMVAAGEHDHDARYFTQVDLLTVASGAGSVWENVFNVPLDVEDGDQDTLASLPCGEGQVAKWNSTFSQWECASDE